MLRRNRQRQTQIQQLLDAFLFVTAFALAYLFRANAEVSVRLGLVPASPVEDYLWLYLILIPISPLLLEANGFYDRSPLAPRSLVFWRLFRSIVLVSIGLILAIYLFRLSLARVVIIVFGPTSFLLIFAKEECMRLLYRSRFTQAQLRRRFLLVGTGAELTRLRAELQVRPEVGLAVVAEFNLDTTRASEMPRLLHEHAINGVIVSATHAYFDQVAAIIGACELEGVEAWLKADFFPTKISRTSFDEFHGQPVLVYRSTPEASWQSAVKQVLDVTAACVLLLVLAPWFLLVAFLIKRSTPGPVLFRQQRAGLNGHPFTMFKFRTMVTNAEQLKQELAALNEMTGPVFKITHDPRVIPIGRFLRKFSIDELPQLYNVLRGEMSLVGPRPLPVDEVQRFDDVAHRRRLSVKPGLTCLWQVSGRNQVTDFQEWVRLDLEYIDNWSLWLDFVILVRTVPAVLAGVGAK
jgi:exopolysaccharide biosynthesis polyprenyl glycosylphosphotransferase